MDGPFEGLNAVRPGNFLVAVNDMDISTAPVVGSTIFAQLDDATMASDDNPTVLVFARHDYAQACAALSSASAARVPSPGAVLDLSWQGSTWYCTDRGELFASPVVDGQQSWFTDKSLALSVVQTFLACLEGQGLANHRTIDKAVDTAMNRVWQHLCDVVFNEALERELHLPQLPPHIHLRENARNMLYELRMVTPAPWPFEVLWQPPQGIPAIPLSSPATTRGIAVVHSSSHPQVAVGDVLLAINRVFLASSLPAVQPAWHRAVEKSSLARPTTFVFLRQFYHRISASLNNSTRCWQVPWSAWDGPAALTPIETYICSRLSPRVERLATLWVDSQAWETHKIPSTSTTFYRHVPSQRVFCDHPMHIVSQPHIRQTHFRLRWTCRKVWAPRWMRRVVRDATERVEARTIEDVLDAVLDAVFQHVVIPSTVEFADAVVADSIQRLVSNLVVDVEVAFVQNVARFRHFHRGCNEVDANGPIPADDQVKLESLLFETTRPRSPPTWTTFVMDAATPHQALSALLVTSTRLLVAERATVENDGPPASDVGPAGHCTFSGESVRIVHPDNDEHVQLDHICDFQTSQTSDSLDPDEMTRNDPDDALNTIAPEFHDERDHVAPIPSDQDATAEALECIPLEATVALAEVIREAPLNAHDHDGCQRSLQKETCYWALLVDDDDRSSKSSGNRLWQHHGGASLASDVTIESIADTPYRSHMDEWPPALPVVPLVVPALSTSHGIAMQTKHSWKDVATVPIDEACHADRAMTDDSSQTPPEDPNVDPAQFTANLTSDGATQTDSCPIIAARMEMACQTEAESAFVPRLAHDLENGRDGNVGSDGKVCAMDSSDGRALDALDLAACDALETTEADDGASCDEHTVADAVTCDASTVKSPTGDLDHQPHDGDLDHTVRTSSDATDSATSPTNSTPTRHTLTGAPSEASLDTLQAGPSTLDEQQTVGEPIKEVERPCPGYDVLFDPPSDVLPDADVDTEAIIEQPVDDASLASSRASCFEHAAPATLDNPIEAVEDAIGTQVDNSKESPRVVEPHGGLPGTARPITPLGMTAFRGSDDNVVAMEPLDPSTPQSCRVLSDLLMLNSPDASTDDTTKTIVVRDEPRIQSPRQQTLSVDNNAVMKLPTVPLLEALQLTPEWVVETKVLSTTRWALPRLALDRISKPRQLHNRVFKQNQQHVENAARRIQAVVREYFAMKKGTAERYDPLPPQPIRDVLDRQYRVHRSPRIPSKLLRRKQNASKLPVLTKPTKAWPDRRIRDEVGDDEAGHSTGLTPRESKLTAELCELNAKLERTKFKQKHRGMVSLPSLHTVQRSPPVVMPFAATGKPKGTR
ncbi:hypothetical protein, variant 1 [Aphanomyces invadans]|nr:hypothetical protein, variant 1 [Aphanomyces invadans]ETV95988.1 hypothetical protein, variant 1 [Aphanomyces invadans]|eukprot:XP_008875299.1 hypothetical protein, variant 1 [Aphanomyces invadans]